jgi:hypothetical protein
MQKNNQIISLEAKLENFKDEPNKTYINSKKPKKSDYFYESQIEKFKEESNKTYIISEKKTKKRPDNSSSNSDYLYL